MKKILTVVVLAAAAFAATGYKVLNKIKIGGAGSWDYCAMDSGAGSFMSRTARASKWWT
jgi:hypothetical protein